MSREELESEQFPMLPQLILKYRKTERQTHKLLQEDDNYCAKMVEEVELIHYMNCIYILHRLRYRVKNWYHKNLIHIGKVCMQETMSNIMCWPNMY